MKQEIENANTQGVQHRRAPLRTVVVVNVVQSWVRRIRVWKQLLVCLITRFDTHVKMEPTPGRFRPNPR